MAGRAPGASAGRLLAASCVLLCSVRGAAVRHLVGGAGPSFGGEGGRIRAAGAGMVLGGAWSAGAALCGWWVGERGQDAGARGGLRARSSRDREGRGGGAPVSRVTGRMM
jgi:hypothetical protein